MITQNLTDIRETVSNGWCQNFCAINNDGGEVHFESNDAVAFDLPTAIYLSTEDEDGLDAIYTAIGMTPLEAAKWNDDPSRTQADVINLLNKAIENES